MKFVIYDAFVEGFIKKAVVEISPRMSWENAYNIFAIYNVEVLL